MIKEFFGKKFKTQRKQTVTAIALILILSVSVFMAITPTANASTVTTHAFMTVSPNPIGVNQQTTIIMWLNTINPTTSGVQGERWQGYNVLITKPDGSTEQLGPLTADPAAFAYVNYQPAQIGTYTVKFNFPGQQVTGAGGVVPIPINDYYEASTYTTTLTVQQEPIGQTPQIPLPDGYWDRPVNAENQEWYTISGNWLGTGTGSFGSMNYNNTGNFNPYTRAPNTAHIVWTKQLDFGGLVGGEFGGTTTSVYYTGKSYEPKLTPPVIINGVLYYNVPDTPKMGFYAVDIRTGATLWWQNSSGSAMNVGANPLIPTYGYRGITMGQVYNYVSPNQIGGIPYLWYIPSFQIPGMVAAFDWVMYDAVTGNQVLTVTNTTSGGTTVQGPNGELLVYTIGTNWLAMWNSSKCIGTAGAGSTQAWLWRPTVGAMLDWRKGIQWNVTTPAYPGQAISQINSGIVLATTGSQFVPQDSQMEIGYDANTGAQIWAQNRTLPKASTNFGRMGPLMNSIFVEFEKETMHWYGYDARTGNQIWGPTEPYTNAWGSQPRANVAAYGKLFAQSIDGIHAFDLSTGEKLWDFYAEASGNNFPGFSTFPFLGGNPTVADGKIFAPTGNSHSDPLFRGASMYAIDANSGQQVWKISGFYLGTVPVADGYLVADNAYDNQLYCFGKGQTKTTITSSPKIIGSGNSVLFEGTVTDQSPGAKDTPAIDDGSMTAWMEYLYMQKPKPADAKGVTVHLIVTDPSGSTKEVGTAVSDDLGNFALAWTPTVAGTYSVRANFEGSESYFGNETGTSFMVSAAPSTTPQTNASPSTEPIGIYFIAATAIIVIAIAIVAVLLLRKKA